MVMDPTSSATPSTSVPETHLDVPMPRPATMMTAQPSMMVPAHILLMSVTVRPTSIVIATVSTMPIPMVSVTRMRCPVVPMLRPVTMTVPLQTTMRLAPTRLPPTWIVMAIASTMRTVTLFATRMKSPVVRIPRLATMTVQRRMMMLPVPTRKLPISIATETA